MIFEEGGCCESLLKMLDVDNCYINTFDFIGVTFFKSTKIKTNRYQSTTEYYLVRTTLTEKLKSHLEGRETTWDPHLTLICIPNSSNPAQPWETTDVVKLQNHSWLDSICCSRPPSLDLCRVFTIALAQFQNACPNIQEWNPKSHDWFSEYRLVM